MAKKRPKTLWKVANIDRARVVNELRRSNAATPHQSADQKMTRAAKRAQAVKDSVSNG